ncbi:MAG: YidC/Oxa1 family membrane protein insertase [Anaerolineae bacterium]|nr:YidC/Oxa1 family membrane protein insertase [Anaerolineae bacterium]
MWDTIVVDPITNLLLLFYSLLNGQTLLAVALLTVLIRLAMIPLTMKQQKSMQQQRKLQPKLKKIQEKYKNDQERLGQAQMKLYREAGVNPASGCLPLLIQLPLMLGLYRAIIRALAATPLGLLELAPHIYRVDWLPNLSALLPLQSQFWWLDLSLPDPYYVLPVLVVITSWIQQKLISAMTPTTTSSKDDQAQAMTQSMQITMPFFMGFVSMSYASGLSVYLVISNLVGIFQYYLIGKSEDDSDSDE